VMKAYALAQRFYKGEVTDLDDSDYSALREVIEKNDQYMPLVLAQVLQVLMEAKAKGLVRRSQTPFGFRHILY
jgi:hypothetical protein